MDGLQGLEIGRRRGPVGRLRNGEPGRHLAKATEHDLRSSRRISPKSTAARTNSW